MHFFFVRNKNLHEDWQDWISGLKGVNEGVSAPYIDPHAHPDMFKTGGLADYLGVPTTLSSNVRRTYTNRFFISGFAKGDYANGIANFSSRESLFKEYVRGYLNSHINARFGNILEDFVAIDDEISVPHTSYALLLLRDLSSSMDITSLSFTFNSVKGSVLFALVPFASKPAGADRVQTIFNDYVSFGRAVGGYPVHYNLTDAQRDLFSTYTADGYEVGFYVFFGGYAPSYTSLVDVESVCTYVTQLSGRADAVDVGVSLPRVSALPFRAYESIYNAYYRNTHGVDPFKINDVVEYNKFNTTIASGRDDTNYHLYQRNYELDFLTSALPSPQAGPAPLVGMSALGRITVEDENGITTAQAVLDDDGNITKVAVTSPLASSDHARTLMNIASLGMSINDFRSSNALQRHLEQTLRSGYRYLDFIAGHFGKSPEYRVLDMPEFIGGFSRDVTVSQILQTTDTEPLVETGGSPLGSFAGNANAFGSSNHSVSHYCDDYGYIIGILSVVPTPAYSQLLPKHFIYNDRLDYYFPEFSQLGMQPITYNEVCPLQKIYEDGNTDALENTFGYQRPNYDLVASVDEVHGNFRTDLRDFLINRRFVTAPELSPDFLHINPEETNDIFANRTPSDDTIIGQIIFEVFAKRPIPRVVIPSLGR